MKKIKKRSKKQKYLSHFDKQDIFTGFDVCETSNDTISLCMIVKNEELNIERSLSSIRSIVHEIIVVDTGSTDRTKDIAKAYGAKTYNFKWTNNFSAARNFSLSQASCDWILILDADEVISPLDQKTLKGLASKQYSKPIAYQMLTRNYMDVICAEWVANDGNYFAEEAGIGWVPTEKVRFFINDKRIRFENEVHELVESSLSKLGIEIIKINIPIHHYGHLNAERKKFKEDYYEQLAQIRYAEKDNDLRAIYQLAVSARGRGKYEEALRYWRKFVSLKPDFPTAFCEMASNYALSNRYEEALLSLRKALELDPSSRDIITMCAECEITIGNLETAIHHLENLLKKDSTYPLAMLALVVAYFCVGKKEKGMDYVKKLRNINCNCTNYLANFAKTLISVNRINYAYLLLQTAVESNNYDRETLILIEECSNILFDSKMK